jgi:CBS domain containing-hemolysin-like protein
MPDLLIVLLVVLALVVLNGLFVAAEFAIIGTPRAAIATQAESGSRRARQVAAVLDDPTRLDRYVATAQLGITFASLGLGMYGEHTLAVFFEHWLTAAGFTGLGAQVTAHGLAVVLAIIAITYLHIVFGEMIPKALALSHAVRVALWVTPVMLMIGLVLSPLVRTLNLTGNYLLRLVGVVRSRSAEHYLETEELESLVRESVESGLLSEESERIFREIADFSEITAAEAMIPRVHTYGIPIGASDAQLREILPVHRHTRYPVYDGNLDHIVGTVHIKDLLNLLNERNGLVPAVVRKAAYLPETATLDDVLKAMERTRNQMVVVMDEHGGTAGILTIEDICAEAIGDVEEGADDAPDVLPVGRGRFQVQGSARLGMVGALVGRELDHPVVDSVSGLILSELGRPPRLGDQVQWKGLNFAVVSLHGHGVRQAVVSLIDDGSQLVGGSDRR